MELATLRKQPARRAKLHHPYNCESPTLQVQNNALRRWKREGKQLTSPLCPRCLQIDFRDIFTREVRIPSSRSHYVMSLDKIVHDKTCAACLFFSSLWGYHNDMHADLWIFPAAEVFGAGQAMVQESPVNALGMFPSDRHKGGIPSWWAPRGVALRNTHINEFPNKARSAITATTVNVSDVDYDRCKSWLQQCERSHGQPCETRGEPRRFSVPLTIIDCTTWEIKQIDDADDYMALSYVWGASQSKTSGPNRHEVPADASQVIQDAMKVVTRLGMRYLWVDQYCVNQHEHDIKNTQIGEMDQIYAGAYATIVAAAGSNARYGLPGVSRPRSHTQSSLITEQFEIQSSLPDLFYAVSDSIWGHRAWTYQEAVLSRRCLFFTEYQVYLACPRISQSEAVTIQTHHLQALGNSPLAQLNMTEPFWFRRLPGNKDQSAFRQLANHIAEYNRRSLTYETDRMNALRGLLARSTLYSFYGLPIVTDSHSSPMGSNTSFDIGFAMGLWWGRDDGPQSNAMSRRPQFPSWTWVGWNGVIGYEPEYIYTGKGHESLVMQVDKRRFQIGFWLEDSNGQPFTFQDVIGSLNGTKMLPDLQYSLIIEATVLQLRFQEPSRGLSATVCQCHPHSSHESRQPITAPKTWGRVYFFEKQPKDRISTQIWDCMSLFQDTHGYHLLMIIKCIGDVAYRVGNLVSHKDVDWPNVPRYKRRIRMM
jgi:hypothetical protein